MAEVSLVKLSSHECHRTLPMRSRTLVQVMAWCRQATSHYLSQCWPRSLSPYGVTRPQWVNSSPPGQNSRHFTDNIFRYISVNENFCILVEISLKFVPKGPINNKTTLVSLQWRHNEHDGISNHHHLHCLLNCWFRCRSKKALKALHHWPLWGEFTGDQWIPRTKGQ